MFKLYSSVEHDIEISRLSFAPYSSSRKPLKKLMNESPLYFLIDKSKKYS